MRPIERLKLLCLAAAIMVPCGAASAQDQPRVEPEAVAALNKMGAYLRTLTSFEISADTTTDVVVDNGQKLKFEGKTDYKVRRPNGFLITVSDDRRVRQFDYDGKSLTVFSPRMGFYATVAAPSTIRQTLQDAYDKFDIEVPLEDLFRWGLPEDHRNDLDSGFVVGYARINGMDADQYAFREGAVDWQIWIQRGPKPVPLKAVITTTDDPAMPEFTAELHWKTDARFSDATFAFKPPAGARPITIATR